MSERLRQKVTLYRGFKLLRVLGEGAMGQVFTASEGDDWPEVAVKLLKPEHGADSRKRHRFLDEAAITALIDHPGTPAVHGVGETDDGLPFYAMQHVSGSTLSDMLAERGGRIRDRFWIDRLRSIFFDVCSTVACAHRKGIVHRDLKPDNILVADDGSVYVLDWGCARLVADSTDPAEEGLIIGTPGYMAPEQARGDSGVAGPRADVFALGVILYQILTGQEPFRGRTLEESLSRVLNRPAENPRRLNRWISKSLSAICTKAMEEDPCRRYADAGELAADLQSLRHGHPISIIRPSLGERWHFFRHRHPRAAAIVGGLALTAFLLLALAVTRLEIARSTARRDSRFIEAIDLQATAFASQAADLQGRLDRASLAPSTAAAEIGDLSRRLELAKVHRLILQVAGLIMVRDLEYLNLLPSEIEKSEKELWRRIYSTVESALETGHPLVALGIIETVEMLDAEASLKMKISPANHQRLAALADRANEQSAAMNGEGAAD